MQYCGGLRRVLASVSLSVSLAVEPPDSATVVADGTGQPSQADGREDAAAEGRRTDAFAAAAAQSGGCKQVAATVAAQPPVAAAAAAAAAAMQTEALHFPVQQYDRVKSTLQSNRQLGMALLEGYDQIPQPTLDVYR